MSALHVVAVHLKSTGGGGKRWYRSVPQSLGEAMATHAEYTREGFSSRVEPASKADLAAIALKRRMTRLNRAKKRTRQLSLFEEA